MVHVRSYFVRRAIEGDKLTHSVITLWAKYVRQVCDESQAWLLTANVILKLMRLRLVTHLSTSKLHLHAVKTMSGSL